MLNKEDFRIGHMLRRIVVPTDFSPNSEASIPYAVELAKVFGSEFILIHAFQAPDYPMVEPGGEVMMEWPRWNESLRKQQQEKLDALAKEISDKARIAVTSFLVEGAAANAIVNFAQEKKADCIVITTHGRTGVSHLVFGSVAERIVRLAPCPVFTVKLAKDVQAKQMGTPEFSISAPQVCCGPR